MHLEIRDATSADAPAIRALVTAAFGQEAEADLVEALVADGDCLLNLVATSDGEIVGHVAFSRMQAPFAAAGLAPLSTRLDLKRRGIGAALVREGLARLAKTDIRGVFVLGDPAYYGRFGFDPALAAGFDNPYAGPHLMGLALGGPLPARSGPLAYAPAFSRL